MRKRQVIKERGGGGVRGIILAAILAVVVASTALIMWRGSKVIGRGRYNLALVGEGRVTFVSVDREEKTITALVYPPQLAIRSRSEGQYTLDKLYTLGTYTGNPGEFARVKMQGFMKTLVQSYLVYQGEVGRVSLARALLESLPAGESRSNLGVLDKLILLKRALSYDLRLVEGTELEREGIIVNDEKNGMGYNEDRLQQYVAARFFDWRLGELGILAAVVNESQETGLASDVAKFLENSGVDVVAVRNGEAVRENTEVIVASEELAAQLAPLLEGFGWDKVTVGDTSEWRAGVVVKLGRDVLALF